MNVRELKRVYFVGIGGIGMSALARFFHQQGTIVNGYDKTETELTKTLATEGMAIHYTDDIALADKETELVIYTPAIPKNHTELNWFRDNNYPVFKRSDVLQWITKAMHAITVAGTHGKTTISTMTAYLLRETGYGCNAFLGGISSNYQCNYWSSPNNTAVIEADEYDRSFLKLFPDVAVLTSMDPDHLDIYGTAKDMEDAFIQYTHNIKEGGTLLVKYGLHRQDDLWSDNVMRYSLDIEAADVFAHNMRQKDGGYLFDITAIDWTITDMYLPIGGLHNVENAIAAITVTQILGIEHDLVRTALAGFRGVHRRFEYILKTDKIVYIDDYAHHPEELAALIGSAKKMFPGLKCTVAFQPHLFSRTRDLAEGFATSLAMADEVILLDIYPARELPMPGITSQILADRINNTGKTILTDKHNLVNNIIPHTPLELFITAGAGDIDQLVAPIKKILEEKYK